MKNYVCSECGMGHGHHYTNCPETPEPTIEETDMKTEIIDLLDSGWGRDEIVREAEIRGWNVQETEAILSRELEGAQ